MDLVDQLRLLASRAPQLASVTRTEEAAKHALVLPFLQALGYNVFDPTEVIPEYVADTPGKKGEKVDYAIKRGAEMLMLFECKGADVPLDVEHAAQLFRYFHVSKARVGVLTNGILYRFYTDLEEPNKMDTKPFLEFNLLAHPSMPAVPAPADRRAAGQIPEAVDRAGRGEARPAAEAAPPRGRPAGTRVEADAR